MSIRPSRKIGILCVDFLLALFWTYFVYENLISYIHFHKFSSLLFACAELASVIFFIVRKPAYSFSTNILDFVISCIATFLVFFYIPVSNYENTIGSILIYIGMVFAIISHLSLNTSFGIIPAIRKIKTQGMYRFVRHPLYLSYLIVHIGYLSNNISLWNLTIFFLVIIFTITRLMREETHLKQNHIYQKYMHDVPWRIFPKIF